MFCMQNQISDLLQSGWFFTCSCLPPVWYLSVCRASYLAIVADDDDHASGAGGHRAGQVLVIFLQPHPGSLEAELEPHVTEQNNHRKHVHQKHNRVSFTHQNHTLLIRATTKPHVTNQNHNTEQHVTNQNHKTEQHVTNQNHNTEHLHTTEPLLFLYCFVVLEHNCPSPMKTSVNVIQKSQAF